MVANSNASNDPITVNPVYYHNGQYLATVKAEVNARYISQSDEYGYVVTKTVPSSGLVSFDCPDDYEYITVSVSIPTTTEVNAHYLIGGGDELDEFDCGETVQIYALNYYYLPWKHMNEVIPHIEDHFDVYRSRIDWTVDLNDSSATYSRYHDEITFGNPTYRSRLVAGHEFGHALHNIALGGTWNASNCNPHYVDLPSSYECALKEGFADYAAWVGEDDPERWENAHYTSGVPGKIEGNVAALFHDLIDLANETDDDTSYPANYVANVLRTCRVSGFSRINDVSDLVWCLENRVDDDVHDDNFPGISAPSDATEAATEPDEWDADDIRSTWLLNVGN